MTWPTGGNAGARAPRLAEPVVRGRRREADRLCETGAATVLAADMGCLMNIAGLLKRRGSPVAVRHVAEVLAGLTQTPAIGEAEQS